MQDSEQFSINTESSAKLAVPIINERQVCKSYTDSGIVIMKEQVTFGEKVTKNDIDI